MKMSKRAKRMEKKHNRLGLPSLNLVSLMDIFTILVFFLLVNSSSVEQLPNSKTISLPKASAEEIPKETLVVMVSAEDIVVQGRKVAEVKAVLESKDEDVPGLLKELQHQADRYRLLESGKKQERDITIMGDKAIPYKLLRKIMITCSEASYTNISLAVRRIAKEAAQ